MYVIQTGRLRAKLEDSAYSRICIQPGPMTSVAYHEDLPLQIPAVTALKFAGKSPLLAVANETGQVTFVKYQRRHGGNNLLAMRKTSQWQAHSNLVSVLSRIIKTIKGH